jgi:CYTH domain-containing protein
MTVKQSAPESNALTREEVGFPIDGDAFEELWQLFRGEWLAKVRWSVPAGAHVVTVDVYDGTLTGLRVAEVEFDSPGEASEFVPPRLVRRGDHRKSTVE